MPVLISTDETQLTTFRGDKVAYPVYITIANISKELRRRPSSHTTVLLGYLPATKLKCFKAQDDRAFHGHKLFHECMTRMLQPLLEAGRNGIHMGCPDGYTRRVWPILAAYMADYPEQCKVTCTKQMQCPRCTVTRSQMGDPVHSVWRDPEVTLLAQQLHERKGSSDIFKAQGMKPVYKPFWRAMPHCNIFECVTPDIMHELHKAFYDHPMKWGQRIVGVHKMDWCYQNAAPPFKDLHHFKRGISTVSQWTMTEHKQMEKLFLGFLVGRNASDEVVLASRGLMEFIYLAQLHRHTRTTIQMIRDCWKDFHAYKDAFINEGGRMLDHFNIPKIHKMMHYPDAFLRFGSGDGTNTEATERLHIDFAKEAYRASNRRDFFPQMVQWLERQEAINYHESFIAWSLEEDGEDVPEDNESEAEDEADSDQEADACEPPESDDQPDGREYEDDDDDEVPMARLIRDLRQKHVRFSDKQHCVLAKKPACRNTSVEVIETRYGADNFIVALSEFLHDNDLTRRVRPDRNADAFDLYSQVNILRPPNPYIKDNRTDLIKTVPAAPRKGRKAEKPHRFDVALVATRAERPSTTWGLEGLRAARIRVIFDLPPQFGTYPDRLVYLEWFTQFGPKHDASGMFRIQKSTRGHLPNSEIVPLSRLVRAAHLLPLHTTGPEGHALKSHTVLDESPSFLLNWFVSVECWSALYLPSMTAPVEAEEPD